MVGATTFLTSSTTSGSATFVSSTTGEGMTSTISTMGSTTMDLNSSTMGSDLAGDSSTKTSKGGGEGREDSTVASFSSSMTSLVSRS